MFFRMVGFSRLSLLISKGFSEKPNSLEQFIMIKKEYAINDLNKLTTKSLHYSLHIFSFDTHPVWIVCKNTNEWFSKTLRAEGTNHFTLKCSLFIMRLLCKVKWIVFKVDFLHFYQLNRMQKPCQLMYTRYTIRCAEFMHCIEFVRVGWKKMRLSQSCHFVTTGILST